MLKKRFACLYMICNAYRKYDTLKSECFLLCLNFINQISGSISEMPDLSRPLAEALINGQVKCLSKFSKTTIY